MTSIRLKFRAHMDKEKKGALYFQVIHERVVRQVGTCYRIYAQEWDKVRGEILIEPFTSGVRSEELRAIRDKIVWEQRKMEYVARTLEATGVYTAEDIVRRYKDSSFGDVTVFEYMRLQSERLKAVGRLRTSETYKQALNSFIKFRNNIDMHFCMLDADVIEQYESYMRANCLSRNTTSFYMRILRCNYNRAVAEGITTQTDPFRRVYTGVDKTPKRAITLTELRRIRELDLSGKSDLDYARDIFLFSFYMRGMSFIDIAYLRKKDLANGYVSYIRKKTGQQLTIRWEKSMQEIVDKYPSNPTQYMLPIIIRQDGKERQQYLNKILFVNRKLKRIAAMAKITIPLSMYVSRHSWASIAKSKNIPLSVISEGMGHDNEETTRIYLAAIQTNQIDEANDKIIRELTDSI